jgi:hypothetical protein
MHDDGAAQGGDKISQSGPDTFRKGEGRQMEKDVTADIVLTAGHAGNSK